ncbi:hypothetical protein ON010_g1 [Phytophthora cinnamomi]|nr:hypothetical protein ON010_g1 [Phytophthora cinnamomi]
MYCYVCLKAHETYSLPVKAASPTCLSNGSVRCTSTHLHQCVATAVEPETGVVSVGRLLSGVLVLEVAENSGNAELIFAVQSVGSSPKILDIAGETHLLLALSAPQPEIPAPDNRTERQHATEAMFAAAARGRCLSLPRAAVVANRQSQQQHQ